MYKQYFTFKESCFNSQMYVAKLENMTVRFDLAFIFNEVNFCGTKYN